MKDLNINFIRYFVTLIDCGKFSTASEQLHLSQPALSKSIVTLEEQIGTPLIKRFHHRFELTDAGHYFYESSVYFLQIYDDFLYDISSRTSSPYSGTVKVSASGVILDMFFPEIISSISRNYPSIKIFTREEDTHNAIQSILSHKADVGTCLHPLPEKYRSSFTSHHLLSSAFHIVFPGEHPFSRRESVPVEELREQSILTPGEFSFVHQEFLRTCKEHNVHANVTCSCSQIQFLISMVGLGSGLAVLPEALLKNVPEGLEHRLLTPTITWDLALIYLKDTYLPLPVSVVIDYITSAFSAIPENNAALSELKPAGGPADDDDQL